MNETDSKMSEIVDEVFSRSKYRFLLMIFLSVIVAGGLVSISMAMYSSSGAAQLDLSRPGYKDVRSKADKSSDSFMDFSELGTVTQKVIDEFNKKFDTESQKLKSFDAFGGDPLNPTALGISSENSLLTN
jgi:hypothetical protein